MLYVFDGIEYKRVDDEEFEKNTESYRGYVVARRLFISLLKPDQAEVRNYYYPNLHPTQINKIFCSNHFRLI